MKQKMPDKIVTEMTEAVKKKSSCIKAILSFLFTISSISIFFLIIQSSMFFSNDSFFPYLIIIKFNAMFFPILFVLVLILSQFDTFIAGVMMIVLLIPYSLFCWLKLNLIEIKNISYGFIINPKFVQFTPIIGMFVGIILLLVAYIERKYAISDVSNYKEIELSVLKIQSLKENKNNLNRIDFWFLWLARILLIAGILLIARLVFFLSYFSNN
ncbi:MAG: hypothetical protein PHD83_01460 [Caldisericia bacterium]|nr:hypothetical protein [Caldisericia bacterium]